MNNLKAVAQKALELAKAAGAQDAWVSIGKERAISHGYRMGQIDKVEESSSRGLGIKLYVDGRYSSHGTTDLRPQELEDFIRDAVAMTRALEVDPFRKITDPALFEGRSDVDLALVDPALRALDRSQREAWCEAMDQAAQTHQDVISTENEVFSGESEGLALSSNGFSGQWASAYAGYSVQVTVREDGDKRPEGAKFAAGRWISSLPAPEELAKRALEEALSRIGAKKIDSQITHMVVDAEVATSLLARLLGPANAASIQQKRSFWAERLRKPVLSPLLEIEDQPLLARGLASRHFDSEGIAAKAMPLVQGGALQNLYVDTYYGRKLDLAPTTGSPSNRVVKAGTASCAELMRQANRGVYVTSWLGGNADPTTGDFSLGFRGHEIQNGAIGPAIGEMNLTGNLLELFQRLLAVGNDPYPYSSLMAPSLLFENVQISGQ